MDFASQSALSGILVVVSCVLLMLHFGNRKNKRLPPGPRALPFLGNVLQLDMKPYETMSKWAKKYGPIFRFKLGSDEAIVVSDHNLVRELLSDPVTAGRSANPVMLQLTRGPYGIINTDGPIWEKQKKFTLRTLRSLGFAKNSMEVMILEEAKAILQHFRKAGDTPIHGNTIFNAPVINSLWHVIAGKRCNWEVEGNQAGILGAVEEVIAGFGRATSSGLFFAPRLRFVVPEWTGWNQLCKGVDHMDTYFNEAIEEHKKHLDTQHPRDFMDHLLTEISETTDPKSVFYKDSGFASLRASLFDLFVAGSETSSTTMAWAMLYLSNHNSVQRKVQEEIERVIGTSRPPSLSDRLQMPYTEAVIYETLRFSTIGPLGAPHRMMADKEFRGYLLPKDAFLMINQYWIMRDPKVWGDGDVFRPERFLNDEHTKFQPHDAFVAFSVGKRACLGEGIAKDTIFLFVTSILQQFNVTPDPNSLNSDFNCINGIIRAPTNFNFVATLRDN